MPTDYAGDAASAYRSVWKASLTSQVLVYWTGVGVIPQTITAAQAGATAAEFGHQIVVWDNFPVNDYDPTRLFLGPLTGRSTDLSSAVAGFTSNPMQEPAPSVIPLFTTADYTWNPAAYNGDPAAAWQAGIGFAGGRAAAALSVFAADNQSVPRIGTPEAPALTPVIAAFWAAYGADAGPAISPALRAAAGRLLAAVAAARAAALSTSQVVRPSATAWDETSGGEYLVIAVGAAADTALYFNTCGWTNPSGLPGGSTPFDIATRRWISCPARTTTRTGRPRPRRRPRNWPPTWPTTRRTGRCRPV